VAYDSGPLAAGARGWAEGDLEPCMRQTRATWTACLDAPVATWGPLPGDLQPQAPLQWYPA
jgi:hypothetical protein